RTAADFARLPLVTKDGYLNRHPLPARCRGGTLAGCDTVAVSSGSTGEPGFWPRSAAGGPAGATPFEQGFVGSFPPAQPRTPAARGRAAGPPGRAAGRPPGGGCRSPRPRPET